MADYLKTYTITLKTQGTLFIGSGEIMRKKDYIYSNNNKIYVPNQMKLWKAITSRKLEKKYEEFLLADRENDLCRWLKINKFTERDFETFTD